MSRMYGIELKYIKDGTERTAHKLFSSREQRTAYVKRYIQGTVWSAVTFYSFFTANVEFEDDFTN